MEGTPLDAFQAVEIPQRTAKDRKKTSNVNLLATLPTQDKDYALQHTLMFKINNFTNKFGGFRKFIRLFSSESQTEMNRI